MPPSPGIIYQRKRGDSVLLEEDVVQTLIEAFDEDLRDLLAVFLPDGRPPFSVPLTKYEAWLRSLQASPAEWQAILTQVSALPEPERSEAVADTFREWSNVQMAKAQEQGTESVPEIGG